MSAIADLANATLLRIDSLSGASVTGDPSYTTGSEIAVRCVCCDPTNAQKWVLGDVIKDATAVIYVDLPTLLEPRQRVMVQIDDGSPVVLYQVIYRRRQIKGAQTHDEAFLRRVDS